MTQKSETVGERIKRIRGEMYQTEFGKQLGVSQGTVSAWERDDKDRLPSADIYFRLAALASDADDQVFFLQMAGIGRETIISAANKLVKEQIVHPKEGDMWSPPLVERTNKGNVETGRFFPMPAPLFPNPSSTIALLVHEDCANRTLPAGDIILLDTSQANTQKAAPFLNHVVVVDIDWEHERIGGNPLLPHERGRNSYMFGRHILSGEVPRGLYVGLLRCKKLPPHELMRDWSYWVVTLSWANHFEGEADEAAEHELHIGSWFKPYDETAKTPEGLKAFESRMRKQAAEEIELEAHCRVLGQVIGWFPSPSKISK